MRILEFGMLHSKPLGKQPMTTTPMSQRAVAASGKGSRTGSLHFMPVPCFIAFRVGFCFAYTQTHMSSFPRNHAETLLPLILLSPQVSACGREGQQMSAGFIWLCFVNMSLMQGPGWMTRTSAWQQARQALFLAWRSRRGHQRALHRLNVMPH